MTAAVLVRGLGVQYGQGVSALRDVDLEVPERSCVAVLGVNGAGKTTLLRAITGLLEIHGGHRVAGTIELFGEEVGRRPAHARVRTGLAQVMEGRRVLDAFTVRDNLLAGGLVAPRGMVRDRITEVLGLFPVLRQRLEQPAGLLSGGEQQMLAIGRALVAGPRLLVMDEPSLGLAPRIIEQIGEALEQLVAGGLTLLLVEQNASLALRLASSFSVLEHGEVVHRGDARRPGAAEELEGRYLGFATSGRSDRLRTEPKRVRA